MGRYLTQYSRYGVSVFILASGLLVPRTAGAQSSRQVPDHVPPKRTSQIHDGFGINSDLPRDPYLPWNRWWWTRMFDAGFKWIRIGQYENSSDRTSWDWIEQKRGVYASSPELEDAVDSLVDNGMDVQVQLLYGNPMYTARSGKLPDVSVPETGSFHNDDRSLYSVFWPPLTPEQTTAFNNYVAWTVEHFKDRIHYWALWNEQDIGYWNPWGNPEQYGHLLTSFIETVHKTDPQAKVIYGGQADPVREFTQTALDACKCAPGIDVYAYHTYPGYGQNMNPETMDYGAYLNESPRTLRDLVKNYPGIKPGIPFFDDEFNSIASWAGSDESVQAKYVPRGLIYNHAAGVKTFVWLLTAGTDGNEYDDFGIIHGLTNHDYDFTPRPVFYALQNTNALFSDTQFDPTIEISGGDVPALRRKSGFPFMSYGFRSTSGKAIVAYWLAAHSLPGKAFPSFYATLTLKNTGIQRPVLIDVVSGDIRPLQWKKDTTDTLEALPITDGIMALADADYFDWPVLPEAPSSLNATVAGTRVGLSWQVHGGDPQNIVVERRVDSTTGRGSWQRIAELPSSVTDYTDSNLKKAQQVSYRLRARNSEGMSASSNIARIWVSP
ncbi:MAG TPA: fibronectin type III domain-containing protein [Terriglobales bacterium]|nr:fibronectin type III domain-containing protein [Terriglobales bacterium]